MQCPLLSSMHNLWTHSPQGNLIINHLHKISFFQSTHGFYREPYMCWCLLLPKKQGYIKSKYSDIKLVLLEIREKKHPTSLWSLTAAPDAYHVNHSSLSAQLWTTLVYLKVPALCLNAGGKQQLGSAMKVGCPNAKEPAGLVRRGQRSWQKTGERWEKEQPAKGQLKVFLCSASVSCAWQATWKQFSFPRLIGSNPC